MVSFNRLRAPKDYSALPENKEAVSSRWDVKRTIGKVAAYSVLVMAPLGLVAADNAANTDRSSRPDTTQVAETHADMQGFEQLDGEARYRFLVDEQYTASIKQDFSPHFEVSSLSEAASVSVDEVLDKTTRFLSENEQATAELEVEGESSDEDYSRSVKSDADFGKVSEDNIRLAEQRRDIAYEKAVAYLHKFGDRVKLIKGKATEKLLTIQEQAWVADIANARGLSNEQFMVIYNNDRASLNLATNEAETLHQLIDENRGAKIKPLFNKTGIDPASDAVILKQVSSIPESPVSVENTTGNALKLLPATAVVIAGAGLAAFVRRRNKAKKYTAAEQVDEEIYPAPETVDAALSQSPPLSVHKERFEDKIGYVMQRSREVQREMKQEYLRGDGSKLGYLKRRSADVYNEMKHGYSYEGKHRKLGTKVLAAVSVTGALATVFYPSVATVEEPHQSTTVETATATVETTPEYSKRKLLRFPVVEKIGKQFGLGRQFVLHEDTVPAVVKTTPRTDDGRTVYTFDAAGNLLASE